MPHGIEYRLQIQMYIEKENELSTFTVQIWYDYAHSFDGSIALVMLPSATFLRLSQVFSGLESLQPHLRFFLF